MTTIEIENIYQQVRPIKIGFLVNKKNHLDFSKALLYNSMLWGWIYNIIIPIYSKTAKKSIKKEIIDLVETLEPDYIVNLTNKGIPKEINNLFDEKDTFKQSFLMEEKDFVKKKKWEYIFNIGIRINPILNQLLNDIDKDKIWFKKHNFINFSWDYENNLEILINIGYLSKSNINKCFNSINNNKIITNKKEFIEKYNDNITCLDVWKYLIKDYWNKWSMSIDFIYIWLKTSISDMVNFWNIRSSGREWLYVSFEDIDNYKSIINNMITNYYYKINDNWVYNTVWIIKWDTIDALKLNEKLKIIIHKKNKWKFSLQNWIPNFSAPAHTLVSKQIINPIIYHKDFNEKLIINNWYSETLKLKKPTFFSEEVEYRYNKPYYAVDLEINSYKIDNSTYSFPSDKSLHNLIKYKVYNWERLLKIWNKISKYIDWPRNDSLHIKKIKSFDIFIEYFKYYWIDIEKSKPWIIAEKIIEHLGWNIDNCRILKLEGVRELLRTLSTPLWKERTKERQLSNKKIREWIEISEIVKIINSKHKDKKDYFGILREDIYWKKWEGVLKYLYEKNIIRPWLTFECNNCFKKQWYWVEEFQKNFICKYCFKEQQVTLFNKNTNRWWKYKPDWLFIIPEWWQGSLATIISIWFLNHFDFHNKNNFIYSTSIDCKTKEWKKYECDYLWFIWNDLILWEAKNYTELVKKDFDKMIELWKYFNKKPILCFSILRSNFSEKEKKLILKVQEKWFRVIPLTNKDLNPYECYDRYNRYPMNIDELIEILLELNLST